MSVYSYRLEQMYRQGAIKRINLITELMRLLDMPTGYCEIEYKRTLPNDIDEMIQALNGADYLTKETKVKMLGLDWSIEQERAKNETIITTE
jgi:DNA-binding Lrp family transcriptional regulator